MLNYWLPEMSGVQQPAVYASVANGYYNGNRQSWENCRKRNE